MKLKMLVEEFFSQYLPKIKGVQDNTLMAYRDTFKLFLTFCSGYLSKKISDIEIADLSFELVLSFLEYLETDRNCSVKTRNLRLAALKSFARMLKLFHSDYKMIADMIAHIPQKREHKPLIGFLYPDEILKIFDSVDVKCKDGFRDFAILHLLADSGARASEIASLKIDYFNSEQMTLGILGKGNRYRLIQLWPKTVGIVKMYLEKYRPHPKPAGNSYLFISQRGGALTRHGIHRLCQKYLKRALPPKRLEQINPVHSFRHSCAIQMLMAGAPITDIKNHLGHEDIQSTMIYLKLDLSRRKEVQKKFIDYTKSVFNSSSMLDELTDWENKKKTLEWLDSL